MKECYLRFPDQCRPLSAPQPPQLRFAIQAQTLGLRVRMQANGCDWRRKPKTDLESVSFPPRNFKISCFISLLKVTHSFLHSFIHPSTCSFHSSTDLVRGNQSHHIPLKQIWTQVQLHLQGQLQIYLEFIKHLHIHRALSLLSICVKGA